MEVSIGKISRMSSKGAGLLARSISGAGYSKKNHSSEGSRRGSNSAVMTPSCKQVFHMMTTVDKRRIYMKKLKAVFMV